MSDAPPVIEVERVYKRYTLTQHRASLRHEAISLLRRTLRRAPLQAQTPFWALNDVSFRVQRGESVAIIGRNGSGKTTLMRVIAGIARPTAGRVQVRGRLAALIGLGAGFLPEMSGRRNIYLNAALHGVNPRQTDELVETIIDFAEIRPFIDSPINHYSSGMAARLGFSIAVHILPDIVLLDEVLAVGDSAFQEKCVARMHALKAAGHTLIFVSHMPGAVRSLCERGIWLHSGKLMHDGPVEDALSAYEAMLYAGQDAPA